MHRCFLIVVVTCAASGLVRAQQPREVANKLPAECEPIHRLRFPGNPLIHSAAFSQDGETLYVHTDGRAVNVWEVLVYFWPELLGGLTGLTTLLCSFALWRILRKKRIVGEPHCRRCNYCLKGCESERCPECGTPVKRPAIGRPMWRRTLPFAVPLAVALLGYGSLWAIRAPRVGYVCKWLNWWSYEIEDWAGQKGVSLARWNTPVDRVLEVDVETGKTRRTLITRPDSLHAWCPLVTTPDGHGLLMTLDDGDRLALVSTRRGRVVRTLSHGGFRSTRASRWTQVAGFDGEARVVYVVMHDAGAGKTKVIEWDVRSGANSVALETEVDIVEFQGGPPTPWARRYYVIPGSRPTHLLELPSPMAAGRGPAEVRVRDITRASQVSVAFSTSLWGHTDPCFSSDGKRVYLLPSESQSVIDGFDLETGHRVARICGPKYHGVFWMSCPDAANARLIVQGTWHPVRALTSVLARVCREYSFVVLICDVEAGRWIGRYTQPNDGI